MANETQAAAQQAPVAAELDEFSALLKREFKPKSEEANEAVQRAVRTLAQQALADTSVVGDDVIKTIEKIIAEIDKKLTEQINKILHHEDYQRLESAWRGTSGRSTHVHAAPGGACTACTGPPRSSQCEGPPDARAAPDR